MRSGFLAVIVAAVLALAPAAWAQDSSERTYGGEPTVAGIVGGGERGDAAAAGGAGDAEPGGLPFTGLDLLLIAGGGIAILATGFGLSRIAVRRETA